MRTTSEKDHDSKNALPVHKERLGGIEAAMWGNEVREGRPRMSVTLTKSYRDAEGNWQRSASLDIEDLPHAVKVLDRCHTWAAEQRYTLYCDQEEEVEEERGR